MKDRALEHLAPSAPRICMRGETDFSLTKHFDQWAETIDFIFGMDSTATLRAHAEALNEGSWSRLERQPTDEALTGKTRERYQRKEKKRIVKERDDLNLRLNGENVAEFECQLGKCSRPYRVVALRKNISKMKGKHVLFDEIRYFFSKHHAH